MGQLSWNVGASSFWNPQGLSRRVMGLLYLLLSISDLQRTGKNLKTTSRTHHLCTFMHICEHLCTFVHICFQHNFDRYLKAQNTRNVSRTGHIHKPLHQSASFNDRRKLVELRVISAVAKPTFQPRDLISIRRNQSRSVYSILLQYQSY